jgi:hypothetical protein
MHSAIKRTLIAGAALAAAALFGSLPYHGSTQAQGVPTQHHNVALVDDFTTLLDAEGTLDTTLFNDVLGPTGAEEQLFNALATATSTSEATTLLDATGASPIFSGDFNGAESRLFEGLFLDTLASEDSINQSLGATATESQTELNSILTTDFAPIPASTDLTAADLTTAVGSSTFDTDLTTIANADYTLAASDFEGFLTSLSGDTGEFSGFIGILTDLTSSFDGLTTGLSTDLSTVVTDITSLLGGAL